MVVHGNTAMLVQFVAFYGGGLLFRRNTDVHKRFMALAAIAVVTPAASRLGTIIGEPGRTSQELGIAFAFNLPLLLATYDFVTERRLLRPTVVGLFLIYGTLGFCGLMGQSPVGEYTTLWLVRAWPFL